MATRIAINGFGRIGRVIPRIANGDDSIDIVAINDLYPIEDLAYLLKYDTSQGIFDEDIRVKGDYLIIGDRKIKVLAERNPEDLPWKELGVEVVAECTGIFRDRDGAAKHLEAGARKVLISAPAKNPDGTFVLGVNADQYDKEKHNIISIGSCTTNCLAPVVKNLEDNFGIEKGFLTTIHAYTMDQSILDSPHKKDPRRGRTAANNIVPTSTGAAKAIGLVIPEMVGRLDGIAVRVPVPVGSVVDLVVNLKQKTTAEQINKVMKNSANNKMKDIFQYTEDPIVSSDIIGNPHSSIFDGDSTMMLGENMVKVLAWYDNEFGFSNRMVDMLKMML
ncbi:MAG: type I glyceraldehyde-3-phosphate dehydrogenase [Candidatus Zixiibacteriota bacterium]